MKKNNAIKNHVKPEYIT